MAEIRIYASGIRIAKFGALLVAVMFCLAIIFAPALPERIIPWWNEGQCWWFNGTVEDKWIEENDKTPGTKDYIFLVNGTLSDIEEGDFWYHGNNTTTISMQVHGGAWDYAYFERGDSYEGYACDSMTLREAVVNGTIEFILWTTGE